MIIDGSICNDYRPRRLLLTNPTDTFTEDYNLRLLKILFGFFPEDFLISSDFLFPPDFLFISSQHLSSTAA